MSDAEVPKPVEAVPEATPAQPTEEKPVEKTEVKAEETSEKKPEESKTNILKTTAKIDHENHRNNRKFDPSTREVTDDPDAIRKQVKTDTLRFELRSY